MTRHPTARRVRRSHADGEDLFLATALEASTWASRNRQSLVIAAVTAVVVILGGVYYLHSQRAMNARAATELTQVRATVQSGNTALAITDLEKYLNTFGHAKTAYEARMMLAQEYLLSGQSDKAVATVKPIADDRSDVLGAQAAQLLAQAYESAKDPKNAEAVYTDLADKAPYDYMKAEALENAARLHMQRQDAAGAIPLYQRLLAMVPETSPEHDVYELRIGEAQAQAGSGATASTAK